MFKRKKLTSLSETELISKAKESQKAFGILYERNFDLVYRFVFKRLGGKAAEAGDITQQTFIKAFAAIHKYEDRGYNFSTWLIRIAQNETNMYFRKQKKAISVEIKETHIIGFLEEMCLDRVKEIDNQEKVIQILNNLKQEHTDLIELRFFQNCSFKEIADIYSITEANAKMRIYRILEKIKKEALK